MRSLSRIMLSNSLKQWHSSGATKMLLSLQTIAWEQYLTQCFIHVPLCLFLIFKPYCKDPYLAFSRGKAGALVQLRLKLLS